MQNLNCNPGLKLKKNRPEQKIDGSVLYRASYFSFELCALCVSTFIGLTGLLFENSNKMEQCLFCSFFLRQRKKEFTSNLTNTKAKKKSMEKITHPSPHTHQRRFEGAVFKPIVIFL
jgi:hypothetical protein